MPHREMSRSERLECKLRERGDNAQEKEENKIKNNPKEKCSLLFCIFHSLRCPHCAVSLLQ
jgi:hypothetical protein